MLVLEFSSDKNRFQNVSSSLERVILPSASWAKAPLNEATDNSATVRILLGIVSFMSLMLESLLLIIKFLVWCTATSSTYL